MKKQAIETLEAAVKMLEGLNQEEFKRTRKRLYGENTHLIDPRTEQIQMIAKLQYMIAEIESSRLLISDEYADANWEDLYRFFFFMLKGESNERQIKKSSKKSSGSK